MNSYPRFQAARAPRYLAPRLSCDCQIHIFSDPALYPLAESRAYTPWPDATMDAAKEMHRVIGIDRGVIVQSTAHGTDHALLLDALSKHSNYRGLAIIDDSVSDRVLDRLHNAGVRGARFNFWPALNLVPPANSFERSLARIAERGWHAKIHADAEDIASLVAQASRTSITVVTDHLGKVNAALGAHQPACTALVDMLRNENCWMMLSGGIRTSAFDAGWSDVIEIEQRYIEAAPDRVIWGTDWPHVAFKGRMPNDAELLEMLPQFAPDERSREKILVDNPARLFGF